jgi:hypothetical protein
VSCTVVKKHDRERLLELEARIENQARQAKAAGVDLGPALRLSRQQPDGTMLNWALTYREEMLGDGLVPFLIAWDPGPHPSETSPQGCRLASLRAEHPHPDRISAMLSALGTDIAVTRAERPALIATIESPRGIVALS